MFKNQAINHQIRMEQYSSQFYRTNLRAMLYNLHFSRKNEKCNHNQSQFYQIHN